MMMRLAFGKEAFPSDAVQVISPAPRVHRAAHYIVVMGLWRPSGGTPGPLQISSCSNCMQCTECFPDLTKWTLPLRGSLGQWNISTNLFC